MTWKEFADANGLEVRFQRGAVVFYKTINSIRFVAALRKPVPKDYESAVLRAFSRVERRQA